MSPVNVIPCASTAPPPGGESMSEPVIVRPTGCAPPVLVLPRVRTVSSSLGSLAGARMAQPGDTVVPSDRVNAKSDASSVDVRTGDENVTTTPSAGVTSVGGHCVASWAAKSWA